MQKVSVIYNSLMNSPAGWPIVFILLLVFLGAFVFVLRWATAKSLQMSIPEEARSAPWFQFVFDLNGWLEWMFRSALAYTAYSVYFLVKVWF